MNKQGELISEKSNWICLTTKSFGEVFLMLQKVANEDFQPFEVAPLGEKGFLFAEVSSQLVDSIQGVLQESFSANLNDLKVLKNLDSRIVNAYLSLESSPVKEFLLFETYSFLGDALEKAQLALDQGFDIVDLRMIRSNIATTHLILTGASIEKAKGRSAKTTSVLVEKPGSILKNYFDIQT